MRYWILSSEGMPPKGGGIGTYVHATAKLMTERGNQVKVFVHDPGCDDIRVEVNDAIEFIYFSLAKYSCGGLLGYHAQLSWAFAELLAEYLKTEGIPDILETQEYMGIAYYVIQRKHLFYPLYADLKIVVTCHAPAFVYHEYNHYPYFEFPNYWVCEMEKSVIAGADLVLSPSNYIVSEIRRVAPELRFSATRVFNPVGDIAAKASNYNHEHGRFVYFGKLSQLKGVYFMLKCFKKLWSRSLNYRLTLVGSFDQFLVTEGCTALQFIQKNYGEYIERGLIELRGAMEYKEARLLISNAHLVIVPSLVDNLPYTVLESMASSRVVLCSRQGGHSEVIVDGHNGFLFDTEDECEMADKFEYVTQLDAETLHRVGDNARKTIEEQFSDDRIYSSKIQALTGLLHAKLVGRRFPFVRLHNHRSRSNVNTKALGLVSVIIPYFNLGRYIHDTVNSVFSSSYDHVEIIIVDDGSTDPESIAALQRYTTDERVQVIATENGGLSRARNVGATNANGQYLLFLDADDLISPSFLSLAVNVLDQQENVHFVTSWLQYFDGATGGWPAFNPEPPYLLVHNMVSCTILVERSSFLQYGRNDPNLIYGMEDWDMIISLVTNGCYGVVLPECLIKYRVRSDSMTRELTVAKRLFSYNYIMRKHAGSALTYAVEVAGLLQANGSGLYFDNPTKGTPAHQKLTVGPLSFKVGPRMKRIVLANRYLSKIAFYLYQKMKRS